MGNTLVRCNSHRAREQMLRVLQTEMGKYYQKPQGFFSMRTAPTGGFFMIPDKYLDKVKQVKGVTTASSKFRYFRCWN